MPWGSGSSSGELVTAGTGRAARAGLIVAAGANGSPGAGSPGAGASDAAGPLGTTMLLGFAVGSARGVFRKTGGGAGESVPAAALTGLTTAAGAAALVRPARALRRACWRLWSLFVLTLTRVLSAGPPGGSAGKRRGLGPQTTARQEQSEECRFHRDLAVEVATLAVAVAGLAPGAAFLGGFF